MSLSPSQIRNATQCLRKWGWVRLKGLATPQGPGAFIGDGVHARLEHYLKTGEAPCGNRREDTIALRAIQTPGALPPPGNPAYRLEKWFEFPSPLQPPYHLWKGRKDLEYQTETGLWVVHDHKTTSKMSYALTETELAHDVQGMVYAYDTMRRENVTMVRLDWLYIPTAANETKCRKISATVDRATIEARLQAVFEYGMLLERTRIMWPFDVKLLDANPMHCTDYGGCPFEHLCDLSPIERASAGFRRLAQTEAKEAA